MVRVREHNRRGRRVRAHDRHLYRGTPTERASVMREFERRYGKRGREVYGRTVGKVRREQARERGACIRERIRKHQARNPRSAGTHSVRGHYAKICP